MPRTEHLPEVPYLPLRNIRLRQEIGPEQMSKDGRVDLVGLDLRLCNCPGLERMRQVDLRALALQ
jgi:hypothetical protein